MVTSGVWLPILLLILNSTVNEVSFADFAQKLMLGILCLPTGSICAVENLRACHSLETGISDNDKLELADNVVAFCTKSSASFKLIFGMCCPVFSNSCCKSLM